ncbi:MAG: hypothetical protein KDA77_15425, partial [Planctomycetaceae bacterium]|nr:hypothetical protein [Planctomycetaceae bacterium]
MLTILYVALGVILGFVILILAIWFWLKYKFRKFTEKFAAEFAAEFADAFANAGRFAPPLRIDLEPMDEPEWTDVNKIDSITAALEEAGYE